MSKATILIYGTIGAESGMVSAIGIRKELEAIGQVDELHVRINSGGGSVWEGLAIYNTLKDFPGRVITQVDSVAASMASVIFMAGVERRMPKTTQIMIHNPSIGARGNAGKLREVADLLDQWAKVSIEAYSQTTGISSEQLEGMLLEDNWMTAQEAKALGFATHITDEEPIPMALDLSGFQNVPEAVLGLTLTPQKEVFEMAKIEEASTGIEPQKLTQFTEEFGAENAVAWIGLDYSEALQKHNEILVNRIQDLEAASASSSTEVESLKAQLAAVDAGGVDPIDKGGADGSDEEDKGPKSLADLIKFK